MGEIHLCTPESKSSTEECRFIETKLLALFQSICRPGFKDQFVRKVAAYNTLAKTGYNGKVNVWSAHIFGTMS